MKITKILSFILLLTFAACNAAPKQVQDTKNTTPEAEPLEVVFHVGGMTCEHCEASIQNEVAKLPGISLVVANHQDSTTKVIYDPSKTDDSAIRAAISSRGFELEN